MSTTKQTEESKIPGAPVPENTGSFYPLSHYSLTYRAQKQLHSVNFKFNGDHEAAIKKGQEYCAAKKIQFINVAPFFFDLDEMIAAAKELNKPTAYKEGIAH